jgi:hypothetical protein
MAEMAPRAVGAARLYWMALTSGLAYLPFVVLGFQARNVPSHLKLLLYTSKTTGKQMPSNLACWVSQHLC